MESSEKNKEGGKMAIIRWEPFREMMDLRRSMERLFDDYTYPFAPRTALEEIGAIPLDAYHTDF